ncbi:MAG: hypothetical protein QOJ16_1467 [Acidobacteriota bacterium]|jgi:hypothetical protein|nr:hypothetical protein [Acidobacteriota bacterium]
MNEARSQPARPVATYLYCVVKSAGPLTLEAAPAGPPETGPPRLVPLSGDLWLVVGDAALPAFSGEEIERRLADLAWVSACAVAHDRVVAHFAALAPVVPMKLFTLFASDERAVEALSGQRERLAAVLEKVAGRAEWGVRIHFDASQAKRVTAGTSTPVDSREPVSGRGFLLRKKDAQEAARNLASRAATAVEESFVELSRHAAAASRREPMVVESGPRLLLDAAFLVPAAEPESFERAVQAEAERLAAYACEVTLTGPWPPYNFIEEVG